MIPERVVAIPSAVKDQLTLVYLSGRSYSSVPSGIPPSEPAQTLLKFPGANSASDVGYAGGAIAPGVPVQLLFWGVYWNDAGATLRDALIAKVQELLSGPYTSALDQYGITPPVFGGSRVVTEWAIPSSSYACSDVSDLVWNLIQRENAYPDPDDAGGRNAYMAFMPPGTTPSSPTAAGAHSEIAEYDPPFDIDKLWVAYVDFDRNGGNLDTLTTSFAHELVELVTDPELDAWKSVSIGHDGGEIGDVCEDKNGQKTARVGSVQVPAYWSVRDQVCVIPTFPLMARLDGEVVLKERTLDAEGNQANPMGAGGRGLCSFLPACCFEGPYHWQRFHRRESTLARLGLSGYNSPQIQWLVAGQGISDQSGSILITAEVTQEGPEGVTIEVRGVSLDYEILPNGLYLANNAMVGNFDVQVVAVVSEQAASGAANTQRTATVLVPFIGYDFEWDEQFQQDQTACDRASANFWKETHRAQRQRVAIPIPDPQAMRAWVSAQQVRLARAAFEEAGQLKAFNPAAARGLLTNRLRRIGWPVAKSLHHFDAE